ncbi:MAG: 4-(cytidine 5'-diphospho)-2-C-methyl-D-erythritol kinase [Hyphomicrobiaceae bacterium]
MPADQNHPRVLTETARAKINLTLRIEGRRRDGYHELSSLVVFASSAADRLTLEPAAPTGITVTGPFAGAISGDNLLQRVLDIAAPCLEGLPPGHVTLEKHLPVAAGVGGGSADAAALLRALRRAFPAQTANTDWHASALALGADVPVCLVSRSVWMTGIGDAVHPLDGLAPLPMVLVNPRVPVPADKTAQVFRALGAAPLPRPWTTPLPPCLPTGTRALCAWLCGHPNDLTTAASRVMPVITDVLAAITETDGCLLSRLSGAGPTSFGIYESWAAAQAAAADLRRQHAGWWVHADASASESG